MNYFALKRLRLSQLEAVSLITIERNEPNRFITINYERLVKRGLIDHNHKLTPAGRDALHRWGY